MTMLAVAAYVTYLSQGQIMGTAPEERGYLPYLTPVSTLILPTVVRSTWNTAPVAIASREKGRQAFRLYGVWISTTNAPA